MRTGRSVSRWIGVVALGVAAAMLASGGPALAQSRQETLIIARNIDDYVTNDVHRTYEYTSQILDTAAYDTLVTVDAPDFTKIQPRLATSWTVSPDGTTYTFKIRPGVKFTSGNPLTANDVRFSLRRLKNLKDNPSFFMDPVKDIQAVDDLTVRIVLNAPDASFLAALAAVPCGVADSKVVMAKGGTDADDAKDKDKATEWLNNQSEGSGPYKLVAFTKNVEAVLERNAGYWGKKPHFAKVIFKHVPERNHAARDGRARRRRRRPRLRRRHRGQDHSGPQDQDPRGALDEPGVRGGDQQRRAEQGAERQAGPTGRLLCDRLRRDHQGHRPRRGRASLDHDPARDPRGRQVVGAQARIWPRPSSSSPKPGCRTASSVKLTYWTAPLLGVPSEPLAAKLQADLAQAGIKVTLDAKERSVAIAEYRAGKIQLMLASWSPDYLDPDPYADAFYGAGPVPKRVKYSNPKVNDIIATAKKEQDPKKREALYMEMNKIALEDVPEIMLIQPKNFVGLNPAIKGYAIHPIWWVTVANLSR